MYWSENRKPDNVNTYFLFSGLTPDFPLTKDEDEALRCQIGTSKGKGGRRYLPYVFTEHGAIMAATVLNSLQAVQTSVFVVRAFVSMRGAFGDTRDLAHKLAVLERDIKARLDTHDVAIVEILSRFMDIIDPPEPPEPPKKQIGFGVKEKQKRYTAAQKQQAKTTGLRTNE